MCISFLLYLRVVNVILSPLNSVFRFVFLPRYLIRPAVYLCFSVVFLLSLFVRSFVVCILENTRDQLLSVAIHNTLTVTDERIVDIIVATLRRDKNMYTTTTTTTLYLCHYCDREMLYRGRFKINTRNDVRLN